MKTAGRPAVVEIAKLIFKLW